MAKLLKIANGGKLFSIDKEDGTKVEWYFLTEDVFKASSGIKVNDTFDFTAENRNGSKTITKLTRTGSSTPAPAVVVDSQEKQATIPVDKPATPAKRPYLPRAEWEAQMKAEGKWKDDYSSSKASTGSDKASPDVQTSIKRQALAHATSRSLHALTGQFKSVEELADAFDALYQRIEARVG
jgi:hypothetical protein